MKLNTKPTPVYTHEGARASRISPYHELKRTVLTCLLWEDTFYEDGRSIAERIANLVPYVPVAKVAELAFEARTQMKLRHVPLLLVRELARLPIRANLVSSTLPLVIQRADELTEFLAIYWKDGKCPLSAQVKKGLASAFRKFNEYELAKYNRDTEIKLRDVLFLCHAKPKDPEQDALWKRLINDKLATPDTWEVALSKQDDVNPKEKWTRLLREGKLGALALLRNLRNMQDADVAQDLIIHALHTMRPQRILPFRFIAAAKVAPRLEQYLGEAMVKCLAELPKFSGHTVLLVDVSQSMEDQLSEKGTLTRLDAACGVAMLLRAICEECTIITFSWAAVEVPARHDFALRDAILTSQTHGGTLFGQAVHAISAKRTHKFIQNINLPRHFRDAHTVLESRGFDLSPDRVIAITDEQSHDTVPAPPCDKGYIINVAPYQYGVSYGPWTHINGWSEAAITYIQALEQVKEPWVIPHREAKSFTGLERLTPRGSLHTS